MSAELVEDPELSRRVEVCGQNSARKRPAHRLSAITRVSFSKAVKTAENRSIFVKNDLLFAKSGSKYSKSAPKKAHIDTPALLRRRF